MSNNCVKMHFIISKSKLFIDKFLAVCSLHFVIICIGILSSMGCTTVTAVRDQKYTEQGPVAQPKVQSHQKPLGSNTMAPQEHFICHPTNLFIKLLTQKNVMADLLKTQLFCRESITPYEFISVV